MIFPEWQAKAFSFDVQWQEDVMTNQPPISIFNQQMDAVLTMFSRLRREYDSKWPDCKDERAKKYALLNGWAPFRLCPWSLGNYLNNIYLSSESDIEKVRAVAMTRFDRQDR